MKAIRMAPGRDHNRTRLSGRKSDNEEVESSKIGLRLSETESSRIAKCLFIPDEGSRIGSGASKSTNRRTCGQGEDDANPNARLARAKASLET